MEKYGTNPMPFRKFVLNLHPTARQRPATDTESMMKEYFDISLKPLNTFGIEATCKRFAEFADADDLRTIFADGTVAAGRWNVIAGGSNILFTGDYDGVLLHPTDKTIEVAADRGNEVSVRVGAGVEWDDFVGWCADNELWGAENLSYIPGYSGSSPVQNIGAYGVEAKDIIESVEMFGVETLKTATIAAEYCDFGYRDSIFKRSLRGKVIITSVVFRLSREPKPDLRYGDLQAKVEELGGPTLANIREAVTQIRKSKLPEPTEIGNAGSFFKNPVVECAVADALRAAHPDIPLYPSGKDGFTKLAAGWLIDRCGWKGRRVGNVGVHEKQALVLVNYGGGTGADVLALASAIQSDVRTRFGVDIEMEVNVF